MNLPVANILIDAASLVVLLVVITGIIYRAKRGSFNHFFHWQIFSSPRVGKKALTPAQPKSSGIANSVLAVLVRDVFTTRVLATCSRTKRYSHLAIFWGFVFLAVSTTLAFITNPNNVILPLYNPVKIFGNTGGALVIAGFLGMFYVRYRERLPIWRVNRSDVFLMTLFLTVVTGFITQQTIYSSLGAFWISGAFWIHMVLVTLLLVSAPFTKFFHALSKPVSLLYEEIDRRNGREPLLPAEKTPRSD
jgi:nitrate reductase gamma subunit